MAKLWTGKTYETTEANAVWQFVYAERDWSVDEEFGKRVVLFADVPADARILVKGKHAELFGVALVLGQAERFVRASRELVRYDDEHVANETMWFNQASGGAVRSEADGRGKYAVTFETVHAGVVRVWLSRQDFVAMLDDVEELAHAVPERAEA